MEFDSSNDIFDVSPQADIRVSINKKYSPRTRQFQRVRSSLKSDTEEPRVEENTTKYDVLRESIYSRLYNKEKHYESKLLQPKKVIKDPLININNTQQPTPQKLTINSDITHIKNTTQKNAFKLLSISNEISKGTKKSKYVIRNFNSKAQAWMHGKSNKILKSLFWNRKVTRESSAPHFAKSLKCQTAQFHNNVDQKKQLFSTQGSKFTVNTSNINKGRLKINLKNLSVKPSIDKKRTLDENLILPYSKDIFQKSNYLSKFEFKWYEKRSSSKKSQSAMSIIPNLIQTNNTVTGFYPKSIPMQNLRNRLIKHDRLQISQGIRNKEGLNNSSSKSKIMFLSK